MGEDVWRVPRDPFVAAWNAAASLAGAVERVNELAEGHVPRWAVMARAAAPRKEGIRLKPLRATGT
jgi:hypothetical protein